MIDVLEVGTSVRSINSASDGKIGQIAAPFTTGNDGTPLYQLAFNDGSTASGYVQDRDFVVIELDFDPSDLDAVERFLQS